MGGEAVTKFVTSHAHITVSPDVDLTKAALHRLYRAGFNLNTLLADVYWEFSSAIGIPDVRDECSPEKTMVNAFDHWLSKGDKLRKPPTWRAFLDVLTDLGLGELSQQIEEYLSDGMCLSSLPAPPFEAQIVL